MSLSQFNRNLDSYVRYHTITPIDHFRVIQIDNQTTDIKNFADNFHYDVTN